MKRVHFGGGIRKICFATFTLFAGITIGDTVPLMARAGGASSTLYGDSQSKSTSESLRKKKKFQLLFGLEGTSIGFFGPHDTITQVGYSGHRLPYESGDSYSEDWQNFDRRSFFLKGRKFVGNSLNLNAGLRYETVGWQMPSNKWIKIDRLYTTLGVGNQWQWDHIVMGLDWLDLGWEHRINRNDSQTGDFEHDFHPAKDQSSGQFYYRFLPALHTGVSF